MSRVFGLPPAAPSPEPMFRLSVQQYHAMIDAGVLTGDDPVELLEGLLVAKPRKSPRHSVVTRRLTTALDGLLPTGWHFVAQGAVTLSDGEPEPDGMIVRRTPVDYSERHPGASDVAIVIEVADTTIRRDRGIKLRSYARAGIPVYWIFDLASDAVEIYRGPTTDWREPAYRDREIATMTDVLRVDVEGQTVATIPVKDLIA